MYQKRHFSVFLVTCVKEQRCLLSVAFLHMGIARLAHPELRAFYADGNGRGVCPPLLSGLKELAR